MVDAQSMAVFHGVQDLHEDSLCQVVLTHILATFSDIEEKISLRAVLKNDIGAVRIVHNLQHGDDVGMRRGEIVQAELPVLESNLPTVQRRPVHVEFAKSLHGISNAGLDINSGVDNTVGSGTQDPY
jgi:hypothetical protein